MRLKPAYALSAAHMKCLVWGEDALAFIHFIPSNLFSLHLVVVDEDLQRASTKLLENLPYKLCTSVPDRYLELIFFDPSQPRTFPHSVHLELTTPPDERDVDDPEMVFVHPQSQFYLDIRDDNRSVSLPPFPDEIRFPTRTAFLDSAIATYLDPPTGRSHSRMKSLLLLWISYFFVYTLRNEPSVLPNGHLEPERAEVLRSLRPENQPYFEAYARGGSRNTTEHIMRRKEILEKLGKYEEARRPLPFPPPGNSKFRAKLAANRAHKLTDQKRMYSASAFKGKESTIARFIRLVR